MSEMLSETKGRDHILPVSQARPEEDWNQMISVVRMRQILNEKDETGLMSLILVGLFVGEAGIVPTP